MPFRTVCFAIVCLGARGPTYPDGTRQSEITVGVEASTDMPAIERIDVLAATMRGSPDAQAAARARGELPLECV